MTTADASLPIAVDAMGGDRGPGIVVEGAVNAARAFGIPSVLVGNEGVLSDLINSYPDARSLGISSHHATQVIGMDESPGLAVRRKVDSSIRVAFDLVAAGKASAVVSPGHTGAIMAAGRFVGGTLPGIARPAIASLIPKGTSSSPTVLIDAGANTDCQAFQLVQFALMGHHYAESALGYRRPRIALLSNGTEAGKGNDMIRSAAMMLSELEGIHFIGYVEGRDISRDVVDVVVCDGFVGNIVLKTMEGSVGLVVDSVNAVLERSWRAKLGLWLAKPALKGVFRDKLDPAAYGGAPLLGLSNVAIKCHGSSNGRAVMNGIRVAKTFVEQDVVSKLSVALSALDVRAEGGDAVDGTTWAKVFEKRSPEKRKRRAESEEGNAAEGDESEQAG